MIARVYRLCFVSDITGEILNTIVETIGVQFDGIEAYVYTYPILNLSSTREPAEKSDKGPWTRQSSFLRLKALAAE